MSTSKEIYDELSSGKWAVRVLTAAAHHLPDDVVDNLVARLAVHFQELFSAYHEVLEQERSEEEAERIRVAEDIENDPTKVQYYRELGWKVSSRAKKSLDLDAFLSDYMSDIPKEALAVVKTKLPKHLQKELTKYESVEGHTYSVKRSQTED